MSDFECGYDFALRHLAGSLAAEQGAEYVSSIDAAVEELRANLLADRGASGPSTSILATLPRSGMLVRSTLMRRSSAQIPRFTQGLSIRPDMPPLM